jgi:hypothetical protein
VAALGNLVLQIAFPKWVKLMKGAACFQWSVRLDVQRRVLHHCDDGTLTYRFDATAVAKELVGANVAMIRLDRRLSATELLPMLHINMSVRAIAARICAARANACRP